MNINLQEIYNRFAVVYESNRDLFDVSEIFNQFYEELGSDKGHLLDLGCGAGEPFARWFIERGWQVTGVDFSAQMLEIAGRAVPKMKTIAGDMTEVDFSEESFDAVIAVYSLFHVPRAKHPALFQSIQRWLRPGGKVLFTYATHHYTGQPVFDGTKEFMGEHLFYSHDEPEVLQQHLAQAGLKVIALDEHEIGGETFLWVTAGKV
jgi:cyclopropane fatty-acyl-phospholipid synthase-like methyltransferase